MFKNNYSKRIISVPDKTLFQLKERPIVESLFKPPYPMQGILKSMKINYPYCWIVTNLDTKLLLPNWTLQTPGDIDIIAGNINNDKIDLSTIIAIQVKVRRIKLDGTLKKFATGVGRSQSENTALMGFDQVLLLHILVRDPKEYSAPEHQNASWINNSNFLQYIDVNVTLIKQYFLEKGKINFGYGWLGWGQVFGRKFGHAGGYSFKVVYPAPILSTSRNKFRNMLEKNIFDVLCDNKSRILPLICNK